jgi:predicted aminopeptidase
LGPELGELYLHTPEDLIVNKLYFYSLSQQTKHLRDITAIVENFGEELDEVYIQRWAGKKGLQTVWENLRRSMQDK